MIMTKLHTWALATLTGLFALLVTAGVPPASSQTAREPGPNTITAEVVAQAFNQANLSAQFGYFNYIRGLDGTSIAAGELSEGTAYFTFYNHTVVERVINNGPMRTIDRSGEMIIYYNPTPNGSFTNPETFRSGTPVVVATLRHQVIVNTETGAFTTLADLIIIRSERFSLNGQTYRLGKVGDDYALSFVGKTGPIPYFMGHTFGLHLRGGND
jgi:hypothetical protein